MACDCKSLDHAVRERNWYGEEREIDHGTQFVLVDGTKVNCYKTGTVFVQGKKSPIKDEAQTLFGTSSSDLSGATPPAKETAVQQPTPVVAQPPTRVFIVYGHDATAGGHEESKVTAVDTVNHELPDEIRVAPFLPRREIIVITKRHRRPSETCPTDVHFDVNRLL